MKVKAGVKLAGLKLEMRKVLYYADKIWENQDEELVVTSTTDGVHSAGSYHPYGYAVDLRTRYFTKGQLTYVAEKLQQALEAISSKYVVVVEATHIHVQYNA